MFIISLRKLLLTLAINLLLLSGLASFHVQAAISDDEKAQTIVHMLDYVSVDYPKFVKDGVALSPSEYEEQLEFTIRAGELLQELPPRADQAALIQQAEALRALIVKKAAGTDVATAANALRLRVISVYALTIAPKNIPDLNRAAQLYANNCMACHGATGHGDGQLAAGLDPQPSNFHDNERMQMRSIYGLYNTISLGVGGTPMRAFSELPESDRWALAFYVSGLRASQEQIARGESLWQQPEVRQEFTDLKTVVTHAPSEIEKSKYGKSGVDVVTYLTLHPEVLRKDTGNPLDITRAKLTASLKAYQTGDIASARQHAISAYLEGFELVENSLNNIDKALRLEVEKEMMGLRTAIANGVPADAIADKINHISGLLDKADEELASGSLSASTSFISSLLILLREGLEAVLVLAAISAFIAKTGRRDALPYFHLGWILAIVMGGITWFAANYLLTISGAGREMTEGVTAIIAAFMLLYIGYWLHTKSNAKAWQEFLQSQISNALDKRTLWAMAGVSFLAVYRELFETILFYEALWAQAGPEGQSGVLGGIAVGAVLLALMTWAILKYSVRLPIGKFFASTAWLLLALAVIFTGNGIAALQEAGVINAHAVNFVSLPLLGIYPTLQGLGAQLIFMLVIGLGLWFSKERRI
jgi:high-affinity iron transporter